MEIESGNQFHSKKEITEQSEQGSSEKSDEHSQEDSSEGDNSSKEELSENSGFPEEAQESVSESRQDEQDDEFSSYLSSNESSKSVNGIYQNLDNKMAEETIEPGFEKQKLRSIIREEAENGDNIDPEFEKIDTKDRHIERDVDTFGYDWEILNLNFMKESNFKEIYNFTDFDGLVDVEKMNEVLINSTLKYQSPALLEIGLDFENQFFTHAASSKKHQHHKALSVKKPSPQMRGSTGERMDIEYSLSES
jgi:hypothetical protein